MAEILNLALPFFGLILLGVIAARLWREEEQGLRWLNIFLIYFALPALIFKNVASAPFEQLIGWPFMLATSSVTLAAYLGVFAAARLMFGVHLSRGGAAGRCRELRQCRLHGPAAGGGVFRARSGGARCIGVLFRLHPAIMRSPLFWSRSTMRIMRTPIGASGASYFARGVHPSVHRVDAAWRRSLRPWRSRRRVRLARSSTC